jgi:hypothetical protein
MPPTDFAPSPMIPAPALAARKIQSTMIDTN